MLAVTRHPTEGQPRGERICAPVHSSRAVLLRISRDGVYIPHHAQGKILAFRGSVQKSIHVFHAHRETQ